MITVCNKISYLIFNSLSLSQIVAGNRSVDTKRSKSLRGFKGLGKSSTMGGHVPDKPLHWINVQILDHRCTLT